MDAASDISNFSEPLLAPRMNETMVQYFQRFKNEAERLQAQNNNLTATFNMDKNGIYLHKRPVRTSNGQSPLAVCGSVYHHAIIYIKQGEQVHALDFGPADGMDVTSNIMEQAAGRGVHSPNAQVPDEDRGLAFMYCGEAAAGCGLGSEALTQAIKFIEAGYYHALWRNCIHAADLLLRVLTRGRLRSAPLVYDVVAGEVPAVDNPMVMMMSMMLQRSWLDVCDGSKLTADAAKALGWSWAQAAPAPAPPAVRQQQAAGADAVGGLLASIAAALPAAHVEGQRAGKGAAASSGQAMAMAGMQLQAAMAALAAEAGSMLAPSDQHVTGAVQHPGQEH